MSGSRDDDATDPGTGSSTAAEREEGRRHIEQFRAPPEIRRELTDLIMQAGGLVWTRPGLAPDKRSLTTIASLVSQGHLGPLREHIEIGLGNGLERGEINEAILHCAIYAGFPRTVAAMEVAAEVFERIDAEGSA